MGGRGLVGMNFDDDKAGGKLEVRRAVVASAVGRWGMGESGDGGGFAGLDWIWICLCALFFFNRCNQKDSSNWADQVGR